jgi:hypothetical protein
MATGRSIEVRHGKRTGGIRDFSSISIDKSQPLPRRRPGRHSRMWECVKVPRSPFGDAGKPKVGYGICPGPEGKWNSIAFFVAHHNANQRQRIVQVTVSADSHGLKCEGEWVKVV